MDINLDRTEGKEKDTMSRIVDESLGDIVLIERE